MQSAIVAKNPSGDVCARMVYGGDLSAADSDLAAYQAKYPTYTFTKYADDQDPLFIAAVLVAAEDLNLRTP